MALSSTRRPARASRFLSTILFVVAIGFAAAAIYIWYTDNEPDGPGTPPPPESAGKIELAHVLGALDTADEAWDYGRNPTAAHTDQIDVPGQHLTLGDRSLFVFIFPGPTGVEDREAASQEIDLDAMRLVTRTDGSVINAAGAPLYLTQHGNVIAVLVGGDQALADEIQAALDTLP